MLNMEQRVILRERVKIFFVKIIFVYIFTFQPSVRKISKNNGTIRLSQILNLGPIKRNLKYLPGNIQDHIKLYILRTNIP